MASFSALIAVMASGMTSTGFFIRACIAMLLLLSVVSEGTVDGAAGPQVCGEET